MSLYGMMRTGVSGMNAQANRLSSVSDNIANSSTTGYKRSSTEFSSLIIPSTEGNYTSGAVRTATRTQISQQGDLKFTRPPTTTWRSTATASSSWPTRTARSS